MSNSTNKARAISFRHMTINITRGHRWAPDCESREDFEAGQRASISLASREIKALEKLPDDATMIDVYRALLTVTPGDPVWLKRIEDIQAQTLRAA